MMRWTARETIVGRLQYRERHLGPARLEDCFTLWIRRRDSDELNYQ